MILGISGIFLCDNRAYSSCFMHPMQWLYTWGYLFTKCFEILHICAQIFKYFAFCTFFALFLKNTCMPLLSRINPGQSMYNISPSLFTGGRGSSKFLKRGDLNKNWVPGGTLRVPAINVCVGALTMFLVKERLLKI